MNYKEGSRYHACLVNNTPKGNNRAIDKRDTHQKKLLNIFSFLARQYIATLKI